MLETAPPKKLLETILDLHPGRLTWNIIMEVWKIIFLSKWVICRFHVNLPECTFYIHHPRHSWKPNGSQETTVAINLHVLRVDRDIFVDDLWWHWHLCKSVQSHRFKPKGTDGEPSVSIQFPIFIIHDSSILRILEILMFYFHEARVYTNIHSFFCDET